MAKEFTKQEAFNLFGQTVRFKETIYFENEEPKLKFPLVEKGTVSKVYMVQEHSEGITVAMLIDEDLTELNKEGFERYCQLVKPEIVRHACSV